MRRGFATLALALALIPAEAHAQAPVAVNAVLSERRVSVGEVVSLEVTATTTVDGNIEIAVPEVSALAEVRRSQSESTSISWTNAGQTVRRERTLRIDFEAQKPGTVTIPPITAQVSGKAASSGPISLEVLPNGTSPDETPSGPATPGEVEPPGREEGNLFVRYRVDKAQAYLGEQISVDLEIFTGANFTLEETKAPPSPDGFWREIIEQPNQLMARAERIQGREWRVYRMWRVALFPLEAGERTIPATPLIFSMNRSIFNAGQRVKRSAPAVKIDVLPLPTEGRPADFVSTNVGEYALTAQVDQTNVAAGQAVVLKLRLSGAGNIKNAKLPKIENLDGFRIFTPTVKDSTTIQGNRVIGVKEAEILLMPLRGGRLEIPPLSLDVFSPARKAYQRLATESIRIAVDGTVPAPAAGATVEPPVAPPPDGKIAKGGLRPIRFRSELRDRAALLTRKKLFILLLVAPPLVFLGALVAESLRARIRRETPGSRRRKAARAARERLETARALAARGDAARAYTEISEVLLAFASERSGIALRGLTLPEAREALEARGAAGALAAALIRELEHSDFARFSPGGQDARAVAESLERAEALLGQLDAWEAA